MYIKIKSNNQKGFDLCEIGGVFDGLYPSSTTRRGRTVENGTLCPTILSGENGLMVIERKE